MDPKTEKVLENLKRKKVGIFCDNANLYHAYQKHGWRVDFIRFKQFISQYCDLKFINYYLVIPAKNDIVYRGTERFLNKIKPFVTIKKNNNQHIIVKCFEVIMMQMVVQSCIGNYFYQLFSG